MMKNILLIIAAMISAITMAQSIEIVSQPTTFAASGTAYAPSEGQPPYIMRFKGYNITPTSGTGAVFIPIKTASAMQDDVSTATLSSTGDQTNKTGADQAGNSGAGYGTASGVHGATLGDASAAASNARLLNYTDNGDGTFDVDVVINNWSNTQTIPNGAVIAPTARLFSDGTKVGIPVIEDTNNPGTYVVAGATFDNTATADTGANLLTKATAILTDLDDTEDLILNSGFDNSNINWYGNHGVIEVRTENGNSYFFANVATAGDAHNVNLQQKVDLTQGVEYTLSFDASSDQERTIVPGIGKIGGDWYSNTESVTLTTTSQTFELDLVANFDGGTEERVFFDMGADTGTVVIDNVTLKVKPVEITAGPTDSPAAPTIDAADVISIYSDTYTDITTDYNPNWSQAGSVNTTYDPGDGNNVLVYTNFNYQGSLLTPTDASNMDYLHIDIWVAEDNRTIKVSPIGGGGETLVAIEVTPGSWNSVDIPVSSFSSVDFTNISQFKVDGQFLSDGNTADLNVRSDVYLDNIYFYNDGSTNTGGGDTTPNTTTYCDTEVKHFNIEAETASAILLTIENSGADKITVSGTGVNSPIDLLFVGAPAAGGTSSTTTINDGVASFDITWAAGTMPETTTFEILWSTEANGGNWMVRAGTGTDGLGNVDTSNDCSQLGVVDLSDNTFMIYPNPVQNTLNVSAGVSVDQVSIFDLTGREVMRATPNASAFSLDVANLNKGLYLVSLKAGDQELTTKLVK